MDQGTEVLDEMVGPSPPYTEQLSCDMLIAMLCDFCVADDSVEYEALYYGLCSVVMADVEAGYFPEKHWCCFRNEKRYGR